MMPVVIPSEILPVHFVWAGPMPPEYLSNIFDSPAAFMRQISRYAYTPRNKRLKIYFWYMQNADVTEDFCRGQFSARGCNFTGDWIEFHPINAIGDIRDGSNSLFISEDITRFPTQISPPLIEQLNFSLSVCSRYEIYSLIKELVICVIMHQFGGFYFDTTVIFNLTNVIEWCLGLDQWQPQPRCVTRMTDQHEFLFYDFWGDDSASFFYFERAIDPNFGARMRCLNEAHETKGHFSTNTDLESLSRFSLIRLPYLDVWMFYAPYGNISPQFLRALQGMCLRLCVLFAFQIPSERVTNFIPEVLRHLVPEFTNPTHFDYINQLVSTRAIPRDHLIGGLLIRSHLYAWYISNIQSSAYGRMPDVFEPNSEHILINSLAFGAAHMPSAQYRVISLQNGRTFPISKVMRGMWRNPTEEKAILPSIPSAFERLFEATFLAPEEK